MSSSAFVNFLTYLEPFLCLSAIFAIVRAKQFKNYRMFCALLAVRLIAAPSYQVAAFLGQHVMSNKAAYKLYFYCYWSAYAIEAVLTLLVIYSIYKLSMAPLPGLKNLGSIIFTWAAGISVALTIGMSFGPNTTSLKYLMAFAGQMQRTSSILTLCLLVFVCFAIRPMGLTYRSRIFGVSLGMGMIACTDLVQSAWLSHVPKMASTFSLINGLAVCLTLMVWSAYFAIPEPKRRFITLPTNSPYFRWNQISEALGHHPGYVAIAGVPLDAFADAELEIMRRTTRKATVSA